MALERKRMGILNLLGKSHGDQQPVTRGRAKGPCETLRDHAIDSAGLKFTLNEDGFVTVSGRVRDESERERICNVIEGMALVEGVRNNMVIEVSSPEAESGLKRMCG